MKECKQIKSGPLYGDKYDRLRMNKVNHRASLSSSLSRAEPREISAGEKKYLFATHFQSISLESSETGWNEKEASKERMERVLQGMKIPSWIFARDFKMIFFFWKNLLEVFFNEI